jgi:hypothetical protein
MAAGIGDRGVRDEVVRLMWEAYRFELVCCGEARYDVQDLILDHASDHERARLAGWIEELLDRTDRPASRRALGEFLLEAKGPRIDENELTRICRQSGQTLQLVRRLVRAGRVDQAVAEARQAETYDLLRAADLLLRYKHSEAARQLVRDRIEGDGDSALQAWLDKQSAVHRDLQAELQTAQRRFREKPTLSLYRRLRELGERLDAWDECRRELLSLLEQMHQRQLLVTIHLEEGEIDRAVEQVADLELLSGGLAMTLEVAKAAERSRPQEALEAYRKALTWLCETPNPDSRERLQQLAPKIHKLCGQLGREYEWTELAATLESRHPWIKGLLSGKAPPDDTPQPSSPDAKDQAAKPDDKGLKPRWARRRRKGEGGRGKR